MPFREVIAADDDADADADAMGNHHQGGIPENSHHCYHERRFLFASCRNLETVVDGMAEVAQVAASSVRRPALDAAAAAAAPAATARRIGPAIALHSPRRCRCSGRTRHVATQCTSQRGRSSAFPSSFSCALGERLLLNSSLYLRPVLRGSSPATGNCCHVYFVGLRWRAGRKASE